MADSKLWEFRIGNFVQNLNGDIGRVTEIRSVVISGNRLVMTGGVADFGFGRRTPIYDPEVRPIPITKDWLLSLGFIENTEKSLLFKNEINFQFNDEGYFGCQIGSLQININYIHNLQNLFFVITGEELNYDKRALLNKST